MYHKFKSETEHFKFYYIQNHSTLNCIMLYNYVKISCTDSTLQKKKLKSEGGNAISL